MRNTFQLVAACGLFSSVSLFGCGSDNKDSAAQCEPVDYATYMASTSPTLTADVLPVFIQSCAFTTSCHGKNPKAATMAAMANKQAPYLGDVNGTADATMAAAVSAAIVGVQSQQASSLKLVDSGKPESSWLMKKIEGSNKCTTGVTCKSIPGQLSGSPACGDQMPQLQDPLGDTTIEKIRAWIKSGAK